MDNSKKLENLLNAIDEIETFPDGSIRIKWKANVAHEIPGHLINYAEGSSIVKGYQVHLNPELDQAINSIPFSDIQKALDLAVLKSNESIEAIEKTLSEGCSIN